MRAALDIALKDLRQRVRDRSALLIAIVAPFALAVLFSVMLGGVDQGFDADWGVVDLDGGEVALALIDGPLAAMDEAEVVTITSYSDAEAAREAVDAGEIQTAIIIPEGFSESASSGAGPTIEIVANPDATISTQVARSVLKGFTGRVDAVGLAVATALLEAGELPDEAVTAALAEQAQAMPDPIAMVDAATADRNAPTSTYYAAAMAILFVFLGAQFGVVSLLTEKRMGTLARIVASPLRPFTVVIGKSIVSMVLAVVSMTVIIVGTKLMLGAEWGDPVAVAALVFAAALAATGVALAAVGFAKTEDQASTLVAIVTITLAVLGGSFFPVAQGPGLLSTLSLFTPHAWFLDGVEDISTGGDIVSSAGPILVLLLIGSVAGAIGLWRARRVVVA
jgi:ABC-2 type transport system permease protein